MAHSPSTAPTVRRPRTHHPARPCAGGQRLLARPRSAQAPRTQCTGCCKGHTAGQTRSSTSTTLALQASDGPFIRHKGVAGLSKFGKHTCVAGHFLSGQHADLGEPPLFSQSAPGHPIWLLGCPVGQGRPNGVPDLGHQMLGPIRLMGAWNKDAHDARLWSRHWQQQVRVSSPSATVTDHLVHADA